MRKAAGVLLLSQDGEKVLLLRRAKADDEYAGHWALPGGHVEEGETEADCARRELEEETGIRHDGELRFWTRNIHGDCDFTTHLAVADKETEPTLNHEHDAYQWFAVADLEQSHGDVRLHPGMDIVLRRFNMDELQMAEALRDGTHVSPVDFVNVLLVNMRITGTGLSYRNAYQEYVWRDESYYSDEHFVKRCAGLPVIWEHPKDGQPLDSREFSQRIVGIVFLPYLKGNEVWGVVKIWDDTAKEALKNERLSTSPCVVFTSKDMGQKAKFRGEKILIEGPPSYMDHLAICEQGVWDKGEGPTGVESATVSDENGAEDNGLAQVDAILRRCRFDYASRRITSKRLVKNHG